MTKRTTDSPYLEAFNPQGYVANREITNLPGHFLVQGSKNVRVVNREKVVTSPGYTLKGAAKTMNKGIRSSCDWYTSSGLYRNLRHYADRLEVWYDGAWVRLMDGLTTDAIRFTPWWSATELIDFLVFVNHSAEIHEWNGLVADVASATTNTLTKTGYLAASTISFSENPGAADTIHDSANGFLTAGFAAGDTLVISGAATAANNQTVIVSAVTASTLTLSVDDIVQTEAAGAAVVLKWPKGTWAECRAYTNGTRKVVIDGTEYTYTGGETTGTLTGVTPDPVAGGVSAGDIALQAVRTTSPAALSGYAADLATVINNHAVYGSHTSHVVYISKNTDHDDFSYTSPLRKAGEGFTLVLDSAPTAFYVGKKSLFISAGTRDWYEVKFLLSADQSNETITIEKLDTTAGQAAVSQEALVPIKKNVAYLSFEPTVDTLDRVESVRTQDDVPLSHPIKDDLIGYNTYRASGIYHQGLLRFALPAEGLELIYDIENKLWQPPANLAISHYSVIDGQLCGHSSISNETYQLDTGRNANGAKIAHLAVFGYDNFGSRFAKKVFDELIAEIYYTPGTILTDTVYYDYRGASGTRAFTVQESDADMETFAPSEAYGIGKHPLGHEPLGSTGDALDPQNKRKGRYVKGTPPLDFFERQRTFGTDTPDGYFEILAYGENVELSDSLTTFKRA